MDFELSQENEAFRHSVCDRAEKTTGPDAAQWNEEKHTFSFNKVLTMVELGLFGVV